MKLAVVAVVLAAGLFVPRDMAWGAPETRMSETLDLSADRVVALEWPATHVVVKWEGAPDATVQLQGAGTDGTWQPWLEAKIDDPGGVSQESALVIVDDAVKLRTRVLSGDARNVRAVAIDAENGPRKLITNVGKTPTASAMNGTTAQPPVISRAGWGADESLRRGGPDFAPVERMVVHHTVTSNNDPNPAATVRAIYSWHTSGNGWNDIGYNFLIDRNGNIYEGRRARSYAPGENPTGEDTSGRGVVGAHTLNWNSGSVGVSLLGTYDSSAPTAAQQDSLVKMLAWEADRHNIDPMAPGKVLGHRDLGQTACPGNVAYSLLPQWRQRAAAIKVLSVPPGNTPGYWVTGNDGGVFTYGAARFHGSTGNMNLNARILSLTRTPTNNGYWLLGADGGVFSFGDARFHGSTGNIRLNRPVVTMATTPSGNGYWLVASDGGIFSFGDARFYGSTGNIALNQPIVGMAATPTGNGYWLVASDGGIFSFGDARFFGSTGNIKLNQPITAMTAAPGGNGYTLVARDGGIFNFNTAFWGSIPMLGLNSFAGTVGIGATSTGGGYYILSGDGGVYTFGDARFWGAGAGRAGASAISVMPA